MDHGVKIDPDYRPQGNELEDFDLSPVPEHLSPKTYPGKSAKKRKGDKGVGQSYEVHRVLRLQAGQPLERRNRALALCGQQLRPAQRIHDAQVVG